MNNQSQSNHKEDPENIHHQNEVHEEEEVEESNIESMINDIKESKEQLAYINDNDFEMQKEISDSIRIKEHLLYKTMIEEGLIPKSSNYEFDTFSEEYLDYYNFSNNQKYADCFHDASKLLKNSKKKN